MYCTQDDLLKVIALETLVQLTDDEGEGEDNPEIEDRVIGAIEAAENLINGYCQPRYTLPFDPVPGLIRDISVDVTIFNLFSRRDWDVSETSGKWSGRYKAAVKKLEAIGAGRIQLALGEEGDSTDPETPVASRTRTKVFDSTTMGKF